ncbi:hypothetical protein CERZMDRAFT_111712 [Cercospora zeae-maydis SCOH1-5]|uniref:FAD-binding domain-containing protein n=1 Tax=Cercospora zeae-maydis SCOH1-5 TaxID=717836 RepID=A0A6A6FH99_9PEZI|nr:hypothetical protein CERZMDRAFT_111712 [Cercospora zeae-maydis SCOH1-5]
MSSLRVLICGGGVAGTSLAFWLTKLGHNVTVVEHFPSLRTTGLQIDVRAQGIEVLRRMGLDKAFRQHAAPEEDMQFVDYKGRNRAYLAANKTGKGSQTFTSEFEIMRGDLSRLIHNATDDANYVFGSSVAIYKDTGSGADVVFRNGKAETFDLMVGADGIWSSTRKMMLGRGGATAVWHTVHEAAAYLTFHDPIQSGQTFDADFYIAPNKRSILVRRHKPTTKQLYLLLDRAAFAEIVADAGWRAPELLKAMQQSDDFYCERLGIVKMDAWYQNHVALLGDVGYALGGSGMGTTCAMIGAYVLAGEMSKYCRSASYENDSSQGGLHVGVPAALKAYDHAFWPFVDIIQKVTEGSVVSWLLPTSPFGVQIFHTITEIIMWLKIGTILQFFMIKTEEKWELPNYEALREVEAQSRRRRSSHEL